MPLAGRPNGCYRLHPVEWNIGQSVGMLVAFCLCKKELPRRVRHHETLLSEFQRMLQDAGVEFSWPKITAR